jgi:hypothetical protein
MHHLVFRGRVTRTTGDPAYPDDYAVVTSSLTGAGAIANAALFRGQAEEAVAALDTKNRELGKVWESLKGQAAELEKQRATASRQAAEIVELKRQAKEGGKARAELGRANHKVKELVTELNRLKKSGGSGGGGDQQQQRKPPPAGARTMSAVRQGGGMSAATAAAVAAVSAAGPLPNTGGHHQLPNTSSSIAPPTAMQRLPPCTKGSLSSLATTTTTSPMPAMALRAGSPSKQRRSSKQQAGVGGLTMGTARSVSGLGLKVQTRLN